MVAPNKNGDKEWSWNILRILAPKSLAEYEKEIINMIKEALVATVSFPAGQKRKYIFEFKNEPEFILEGPEYNSKDIYKQL